MATVADLGNDQEDKDKQLAAPQEAPTVSAPSTGQAAPQPMQPQGSGRFTNIGKYLQANVGAGQQIGGNIQRGIQKDIGAQQKKAEGETEAFRQGVQASQSNIQKGAGYLGQLGGNTAELAPQPQQPPLGANISGQVAQPQQPSAPASTAPPAWLQVAPQQKLSYEQMMQLAADQAKLQEITGFRTGATQQADIATMQAKQQTAAEAAAAANQRLAERQSQLGSAPQRYGLLGEFVGKPGTYTKGAQQLDQVFLQRDKANTLGNLIKNLNQQKATTFKGLTTGVEQLGKQAAETGSVGQQLAAALGKQTEANVKGQISDIQSMVGTVQKERAAEQERYKKFFSQLTGRDPITGEPLANQTQAQAQLDPELFKKFGLFQGQQAFNALSDKDLRLANIANLSGQLIDPSQITETSYRDIATQKDVDIYKALSQLAGKEATDLTQAGKLEAAAGVKTGEGSLADRLARAQQAFLEQAAATTLTGEGKESYRDNWGKGGESTMYATQNIGELLRQIGYNPGRTTSGGSDEGSVAGGVANTIPFDPGGAVSGVLRNAGLTVPTLGEAVGGTIGGIGRAIFGEGGSAGAERAAMARAKEDLMGRINQYMRQSGYGNIITTGGTKDTSDIMEQMNANTQQLYQAEKALANINRPGFMGGTVGAQVPLTVESSPEDIAKAARNAVPKTQMVPDRGSELGWSFRELSPQEQEQAYQDNLNRFQAQIDQVRQLQGQRRQYTTNLQNLLSPTGASGQPADIATGESGLEKGPIMSYAEAVAAARARAAAMGQG